MQLDDKTIDSQKISIAPRSSTRISTRFLAPSQGWHVLNIKIEVIDDLEIDNIKQLPLFRRNEVSYCWSMEISVPNLCKANLIS
jgi:hypothetical protein